MVCLYCRSSSVTSNRNLHLGTETTKQFTTRSATASKPNILVHIRPVHPLAPADQGSDPALLGRCIAQAREPFERGCDFPPVRQRDAERGVGRLDVDRRRVEFQCRDRHAMSLSVTSDK